MPILALALGLVLLAGRLSEAGVTNVLSSVRALPAAAWAGAALFTLLSLAAVGRYDVALHRALGTGIAPGRAQRCGMAAAAVTQAVGFGALSGALVRWRLLPELGLWTLTRLSAMVSLSFILALGALVTGAGLLRSGQIGLALLFAAALGVLIFRLRPALTGGALPGLGPRIGGAMLLWTAADMIAAGLVLAVLLPGFASEAPAQFLAAYALALGAGLLSQSPGGLGAFELTLLALLPQIPEPELLGAVLAYRLVHHLLPAALVLPLLLRGGRPGPAPALRPLEGSDRLRALQAAPEAGWGLAHQGATILLDGRGAGWLARRAGGTLAALGRASGRPRLEDLRDLAARLGLTPALYRCPKAQAAQARRGGWRVLRIAREAVLDPASWSPDTPACRQLRRKLRQAEGAGVRIEGPTRSLPIEEMTALAAGWAARHGGERGFSIGRFEPRLLYRQEVFLARREGRLIGFASFHASASGWTLDLMRQAPGAPGGTMALLVAAGIAEAGRTGAPRLSLDAVPNLPPLLQRALARLLGQTRAEALAAPGLLQFKRGFGPAWRPLYLAAPGRLALLRAALEITLAVRRPAPLHREPPILPPCTGLAEGAADLDSPPAPVHKAPERGAAWALRPVPMRQARNRPEGPTR
ncbi:DUF2156 domain-containing protein [Pseudoroseicyclus aestuarii]|uniref:DUF2156 domain-containing protein n=1 Tax=Pseudoroseicyclus aestuarii TaxID=1795041 RepID=UPI0015E8A946|nr:DUF2156 domain-containing protein [Pseudoroseicyclus aestuarii]